MDDYPISSNSLEKFYCINGNHFGQQYKEHLSDYKDWDQRTHADKWMVFSENMGTDIMTVTKREVMKWQGKPDTTNHT
ncbi:MAG: hypothetical protein DRJ07_14185 [Bacteroidetes bacterium]|nr:MAG: hypothetical protein DRJ07_14185 [Bacteroidota bacterium]